MDGILHAANSATLLSTKIAAPRLRSPLVARDGLLARLDGGFERKLTLISAPAGFGKTTLVSAWIARGGTAAAWVSLEESDNDPLRFWRYLIAACQPFAPELGAQAMTLLQNPKQPLETVLTLWINELSGLAERCVLVLEDYHAISAASIHEGMAFLLDHLPPTLHLMMTTRADPPLPLARLRVRDELCELHAPDLRFSSAETRQFLSQMIPFPISAEATRRLEAQTEGWAAGLRLAALALQGRDEAESFLTSFDGSHHHVVEYLIGEVFARQPAPIQQFLLRTAFLSRLNADLCDAISGRDDSAEMLDALERANLFLTTADGQWYRYHALFAEAMQHYARRSLGDEQVRDLHRRASGWYEQHGLAAEAVEAALDAEDYARAASLLESSIQPFETSTGVQTLCRLLERLPDAVMADHPDVCLIDAVVLLFAGDRRAPTTWAQMQKPLRLAEQRYRDQGQQDKLGGALALRSLALWWQDDYETAFASAHQALDLLSDDQLQWRAVCAIALGMENLLACRLDAARRSILEGQTLSAQAGNEYGRRAAMGIYGDVLLRQGDLYQAEQVFRQMLAQAADDPSDQAAALCGLARLAYEWNDLPAAESDAMRALAIAEELHDAEVSAVCAMLLARLQIARGQLAQAQRWIARVSLAQVLRWPHLLQDLYAVRARLALLSGELPPLPVESEPDQALHTALEMEAILKTRITMARGETAQALALLDQRQPRGETRAAITILLLKALAYAQEGSLPQAKQALVRALLLAQPGDHRRLFLDEGAALAALLQETLHRISSAPLHDYARRLLADFAREQRDQSEITPVAEPLSPQERRVLALLSSGLTNPEIAQELVVSINTVKTQIKSIYRKLNVSSRQQASAALRGVNVPVA